MRRHLLFLTMAACWPAAAAAAGDPPAPPGDRRAPPLLVAHADGSWTITREIHEAPVALALATEGLLLAEPEPWPSPEDADERERLRQTETEEAVDRAFEEAIDYAREFEQPH